MALTIKYKVSPDAVIATLYRKTGAKIDLSNLPTDKVVLDKSKTEYIYTDGVNNTHYSFVIETIDTNGRKNYSISQDVFYKTELGPGPSKISRGYFDFGVFGEITSDELGMTPDQVRGEVNKNVGNIPALQGAGNTWYKCLVDGKIIYIAKDRFYAMGASAGYTAAALYTTRLCDAAGLVDDCPIIQIKGNEYKYRSLCHHNTNLTGADALAAIRNTSIVPDKYRSELGMYLCLSNATSGGAGTDREGLGLPYESSNLATTAPFRAGNIMPSDGNGYSKGYGLGTTAWPNAGTALCVLPQATPVMGYQGSSSAGTSAVSAILVLELLD